jgi:hypothetical protein
MTSLIIFLIVVISLWILRKSDSLKVFKAIAKISDKLIEYAEYQSTCDLFNQLNYLDCLMRTEI